jgi:hypothetical protein
MVDQPFARLRRQVADGVDVQAGELRLGLRADAVDLAHRQRPDLRLQLLPEHDGDPVRLVEFAGHLGHQLVRGHADGAGEAGGFEDRLLDQPRQHPAAFALAAGHAGEVDEHLVDAAVLHHRRDLLDDALERAGKAANLVEIHRQDDGLGAQARRLHHPHRGADAELARRVGGGGDDAAADVIAQQREGIDRDFRQRPARKTLQQRVIGAAPAAADDHRQSLELGIAQQLHGREERVHVEVGNATGSRHPPIVLFRESHTFCLRD